MTPGPVNRNGLDCAAGKAVQPVWQPARSRIRIPEMDHPVAGGSDSPCQDRIQRDLDAARMSEFGISGPIYMQTIFTSSLRFKA